MDPLHIIMSFKDVFWIHRFFIRSLSREGMAPTVITDRNNLDKNINIKLVKNIIYMLSN